MKGDQLPISERQQIQYMHKSPIASKRKFDDEPMSKSPAVTANELQQYIVRMKH